MKNPYLFLILSLFLFSCSLPNTIIVELESKNSTDVSGSVVFFEEESFSRTSILRRDYAHLESDQEESNVRKPRRNKLTIVK